LHPQQNSEARTRWRNFSGVSGDRSGLGAATDLGFTAASSAALAAFFAALRTASCASRLVANAPGLRVNRFGRRTVKVDAFVVA
jgi:hypothetical protein